MAAHTSPHTSRRHAQRRLQRLVAPYISPPGKKEKITITAEKGRLSQDEIERMVKEAEEFAEQDKAITAKSDAKNQREPAARPAAARAAKKRLWLARWAPGGGRVLGRGASGVPAAA